MSSSGKSIVVVGDGWAALGLAGFLSRGDHPVAWISATGSRIVSPLPGIETGEEEPGGAQGALTWAKLAHALELNAGPLVPGSFLREYRNKAFREPMWMKAATPLDRREARNEILWEPERIFAPIFEARFHLSLAEIDEKIRERLTDSEGLAEKVRRIEGIPLQSVQCKEGRIESATLASGEVIPCETIFFADRWNTISQIEGLPKGLGLTRKRNPVGVLQAVFTHESPMGADVQEGFFNSLHKEAGEAVERHVWGYFSSDGMKSYWTICLSSDEAEDNHAIGKKLRRMKNNLDRMFSGTSWVPEGKADFLSNVKSEQVRFEESTLFSEGEIPNEPVTLEGLDGLYFLTDGYGPASAMKQVEGALQASGMGALSEVALLDESAAEESGSSPEVSP